MAFPASPSNNQIHKESGQNRAWVYDSATGTWDQVRETDSTLSAAAKSGVSFPVGHIIQTVNNSYSAANSTSASTTTFSKVVDSSGNANWNATIQGVTAGNDILVHCIFNGYVTNNGTNQGGAWGIIRGSTSVYYHTGRYNDWDSLNHYWYSMVNLQFLDVNPGAGSHTYYLGQNKYGGSTTMNVNSANIPFNMTLQEIQR